MSSCSMPHEKWDPIANGPVQVGELPEWMRIRGKLVWYVFQGSYADLGKGWGLFMEKVKASGLQGVTGPPGDIYVCDPEEHPGNLVSTMTTILWAPLKDG